MSNGPRYDYNHVVRVRQEASEPLRVGARAWIVGVFTERPGPYFDRFPPGAVYTIEYEDGMSHEAAEQDLENWD